MNCTVNSTEPPRSDASGKILKSGLGEMGNTTISDELTRIEKGIDLLKAAIED